MGLCVLLGINQRVGQPVSGRGQRHDGQRGAIVVGGALVVSASLLKAGGQGENGWMARVALERLAQPSLGMSSVVGRKSRTDSALEVARGCVLHGDGLKEGQ